MKKMTIKTVMKISEEINAGRVVLTLHKGVGNARAIRISGCLSDTAKKIGYQIESALQKAGNSYAGFRQAPGFAAVWIR